jgi:hypothetical protein
MPRIDMPVSRIVAGGMLREGTPLEDYTDQYRLWVKREDKACPPPGPPFSKTRGVFKHVESRPEKVIGVLDTYHSQAGHAVARACDILGKRCINYYPEFKNEPGCREPQKRAMALGATAYGLKAGRSAILFHQAKKLCLAEGGYMMPNALKLEESVEETAKEVDRTRAAIRYGLFGTAGRFDPVRPTFDQILVPASSGTLAAGVMRGFGPGPHYLIHMGYSRSKDELLQYVMEKSGLSSARVTLIDEGYAYKDKAKPGETPPWPCNEYYDLKAFRWWLSTFGSDRYRGSTLFWNIG